jgi:hypothetical protein
MLLLVCTVCKFATDTLRNTLVKFRRKERLLVQFYPLRGLNHADICTICSQLIWIMVLACQVSEQTSFAYPLLAYKHKFACVQPFLSAEKCGVVCLDCLLALVCYLNRNACQRHCLWCTNRIMDSVILFSSTLCLLWIQQWILKQLDHTWLCGLLLVTNALLGRAAVAKQDREYDEDGSAHNQQDLLGLGEAR